ncbi:hypothetical protein SS50377_24125 [Spironucleus salmonicida]|uniref:Uncharacterized protein n=1 Tax=Spironucleus salmonicida TaxID=348837 RepID=V6LK33_9EUKA|nr:hypothetical protein SS50377_24125 [Spironucleus salmonicida]|eukprot:EST44096.1 Hypothetical protein SS50377_16095 [Spironucleus salmonicida]
MGCGPIDCVIKKNQSLVQQPVESNINDSLNINTLLTSQEPQGQCQNNEYHQQQNSDIPQPFNNDLDNTKTWINTPEPPINLGDEEEENEIQTVKQFYFTLQPEPLPPIHFASTFLVQKQELKPYKIIKTKSMLLNEQQQIANIEQNEADTMKQQLQENNESINGSTSQSMNTPLKKKKKLTKRGSKLNVQVSEISHKEIESSDKEEKETSIQSIEVQIETQPNQRLKLQEDEIKLADCNDAVDVYVEEANESDEEEHIQVVPLSQGYILAVIEKNDPVDEYIEDEKLYDGSEHSEIIEQPLVQGQNLADIERNDPVDEYLSELSIKQDNDSENYEKELTQGKQFQLLDENQEQE